MSTASAYLVAAPEMRPPTRIVPLISTALLHVVVVAVLVDGIVVNPGQPIREEFEVVDVPKANIELPIDTPLPPNPASLTNDIDLPPTQPPVIVIEQPPIGVVPPDTWTIVDGDMEKNIRVASVVAPKLLQKHEPPYPPASRRMGEQGVVKLMLSIAPNGRVTRAQVLQSSGYSRLDQAAIDAVQLWRYSPAQRDGAAVSESMAVLIRFSLT
jgi:periplasmic protein TonB